MKGNKRMTAGAIALLAASTVGVSAADVVFSYSDLQEEYAMYGKSSKETYDVAIRIAQPELVGSRITSFSVPMFKTEGIDNISVWLSKELNVENKLNKPDILSVSTTIQDDDYLHVTFDNPYTITEEGVYVGYTFTVTETGTQATDKPVALTYGTNPDAFYFRTNRQQLAWIDNSTKLNGMSYISVTLDGDFPAVGATFSYPDEMNVPLGTEDLTIPVSVYNSGTEPVRSLKFELTEGELYSTYTLNLDANSTMQIMRGYDHELTLPNILPEGMSYPKLRLTEINGEANPLMEEDPTPIGVFTYSDNYRRRAVVEEYTGLWCGWCPRGYVSLERMSREEPDFIGVAIHSGDDMQTLRSAQFPNEADGLPTAWVDRTTKIDPSYILVREVWNRAASQFSYMEVEVDTEEIGENQVKANARVRFARPVSHDYSVFFYLLGHGMTYNRWEQTNYFSGRDPELYPGMEEFINAPEKVRGLEYNDVLLMFTDPNGLEGSLPFASEITPGEWLTASYTFNLDEMESVQAFDLRAVTKGYSVVAGVVNNVTGEIANAAKAWVGAYSSVELLPAGESEVLSREYFDLSGRRLASPQGFCIERQKLSDGSIRCIKRN